MSSNLVFVDRRRGEDRRLENDPANNTSNKRQYPAERRDTTRDIIEDYYAYMRKTLGKADYTEPYKSKS